MARRAAQSIEEYKTLTQEEFLKAVDIPIVEGPSLYTDPWGNVREFEDRKTLMRADTGSPLAVVGKNFNFVQPKEHILSTLEVLTDANIEFEAKHLHIINEGRTVLAVLDLPQFQLFQNTEEEQTTQFLYKFQFDAKGSDLGKIGFLRMICTNGMLSFNETFKYALHHKGKMEDRARQAIELYKGFDGAWKANETTITRLNNSYGNKQEIANYIGDGEITNQNVFKGPRWAKKMQEAWLETETNNLWQLYNLFTYMISHHYGNQYDSKMQRMQVLNKEAKTWPKRFKVVGANPFNN